MAVYKQAKSKYWWYKFNWNGEAIRESTKQANKRVAETIESAHRTRLAEGLVGIREKKKVPTLKEFAESEFLPSVRIRSAAKPRTVVFYENSTKNLLAYEKLARLSMDAITADVINGFVEKRQKAGMQVSTINRDLAALRRMFHLAHEWKKVGTILPTVRMLPGERQRERVLTPDEESKFLEATVSIGEESLKAYERALKGIRVFGDN